MTLFPDTNGFLEARDPWIPTLCDLIHQRDDLSNDRYSNCGIENVDWGSYLATQKSDIIQLFNETYLYRRIAGETLEQWQIFLQRRFDEVAPRYARAFRLYAAIPDDVTEKQTTTYNSIKDETSTTDSRTHTYNNVKDQESGTDTDEEKSIDTPDSAINASDNYADSLTKRTSTAGKASTRSGSETDGGSSGGTRTRTGSITVESDPEGGLTRLTNEAIAAYRNLVKDFVDEFSNCFKNVYWY